MTLLAQRRRVSSVRPAPAGLALATFGPGERVTLNDAAARLFGRAGRTTLPVSDLSGVVSPEEGAASPLEFSESLDRLLRKGDGFSVLVATAEGRRLRASGEARGSAATVMFEDVTESHARVARAEAKAAAAELSTTRLEAAMQARGEIAWIVDRGGEVVWRSAAFRNAAPETRSALTAKPCVDERTEIALPAEDDEGEPPIMDVFRHPLANGEALILARPSVRQGEDAAFSRFVNTMAETFAHLKVGLMIFDQHRRLILFNPAMVRLFSADAARLARRPTLKVILDDMRESRAIPEQTDYIAWRDALLRKLEDGGDRALDEVWHLSDGRSLHILARPHPTGGLAMTAEDISEAVALKRSNAAERAVLHATTDFLEEGLVVFGPDGLSRVANNAFLKIWGLPADQFDAPRHVRHVAERCAGLATDPDYWDRAVDMVAGGGGRRSLKMKLGLEDGRSLSARFSPMPDGSSLLVFADVTASERVAVALRERNEALEHADEMRGALVDQITHQMRTPLNAVFGFSQLLGDERFGELNPRQRDYVAGITASSTELLSAIDGMTELVSIEGRSLSLGGELIEPAAVAEEVVMLTRRRFEEQATRIETNFVNAPHRFRAHKARFRQVVFNLLMDAQSKSPPGEPVRLTILGSGGELVLRCVHNPMAGANDRGLGISLIRRFLGLYGGSVSADMIDEGRRVILCRLPECEDAADPGPLLVEESLATAK